MIGQILWWLLARLLGNGTSMTDETYAGIMAAIREDGEAMGL